MQPLAIPLLLLFLAGAKAQDFQISLADMRAGELVTNIFSLSVIVGLPPCKFVSHVVEVNVTTGGVPGPPQQNFTRPACLFRRDLISFVVGQGGVSRTYNVGVKLIDLSPGTDYSVQFTVNNQVSNVLPFRTLSRQEYKDIDVSFGRTGAMVVITVLLSIAMVLLIVFLIIALVLKR